MRNLEVYIECNGNMINVGSITGHIRLWQIYREYQEDDFLFATERYDRKILDTSKELMGRKFH